MAGPNRQSRQNRQNRRNGFNDKDTSRMLPNGKRDRKARNGSRERSGYGEIVPYEKKSYFTPWNEKQKVYAAAIKASSLTFAIGPAGTAKSHVPMASNIEWLYADPSHMFVLTNPDVGISNDRLGPVPGDVNEKIAPAVRPMRDILNKILGASEVDRLVDCGKILFEHLGSILGTTFDNAMILLDEAQNATPDQTKALLTRLGKNSRAVLAGDYLEQKFIPGASGLKDALHRFRGKQGVTVIEFTLDDVVRSPFCRMAIEAYRQKEEEE